MVGRFEEMYRAEHDEGFDSWHQEDQRVLVRVVAHAVLEQFNFDRILDVGCGKGAFTHLLKKANNHVVALDMSSTAIDIARARYPDIEFMTADVAAPAFDLRAIGPPFELVVSIQTLSYLERWRELLAQFAQVGRHVMIVLDVPENPIGFVKTFDDLAEEFTKHCRVLEDIRLVTQYQVLLFGRSLRVSPPPSAEE